NGAQKADLRWGFKVRSGHRRVHALEDASAQSLRFLPHELAELRVVGVRHVGMPQPKTLVVRANERVLSLKIDMVAQDHKRAATVFGADSARGIRQNDGTHSKNNLARRITFVEMRPALHYCQGNVVECPKDKYARMTFGRALRKMGNFFVGDAGRVSQPNGDGAESRPQHQADARAQTGALKDELRRLFSAEEVVGGWACHVVQRSWKLTGRPLTRTNFRSGRPQ